MTGHAVPSRAAKPYLDDGDVQLYHGDAITVLQSLPAGIVQTCVTSPPYWGLRDYGASGQLGLEATPELYVERIVAVFREVRRVLRGDGTLWLNLGDSYASGGRESQCDPSDNTGKPKASDGGAIRPPNAPGLKPKDLVGIPWRVAFALQADGWYLRSDIIWSKPNPMPESVTDRPTKSHEYLFLLTKQPRYYYDADAIREQADESSIAREDRARLTPYDAPGQTPQRRSKKPDGWDTGPGGHGTIHRNGREAGEVGWIQAGRNRRSVWTIPTEPFPEAHFATYPQALVTPCILAGTSERGGCAECGAPWRRVTSTEYENPGNRTTNGDRSLERRHETAGFAVRLEKRTETTGWEPTCRCVGSHGGRSQASPQIVLDPFVGSGTTALVARKHGRRCIGIDLSAEYLAIAAKRTQQLSLLGQDAGRFVDTDTLDVA